MFNPARWVLGEVAGGSTARSVRRIECFVPLVFKVAAGARGGACSSTNTCASIGVVASGSIGANIGAGTGK